MWKATFSWHVEDMDLYGINFLHHGAPKTWYCVPPQYGYLLEKAARELFPNVANWCSNFMRHKTCLISPHVLEDLGVPFQRVVQEERDIIIVFPYAYHAGFNHGFNIAESTNFATERWIEYGKRHRPCDCSIKRVKIDMGIFVKRFQPELYEKWLEGKDIAPHPEDPEDVKRDIMLRAENPEAYARMMEERMRVDNEGIVFYTTRDGKNLRYDTRKKKLLTKLKLSTEEVARFSKWQTNLQKLGDQVTAGRIVIDEYQHHEMARLKVKVKHGTMECVGNGLSLLQQFLGKPDLTDIKELIDKGEMIKIGQKTFIRDPQLITDSESADCARIKCQETMKKSIKAHCYKHILEDVEAVVDPETMELLDEPSDELKSFLTTETIKEVIDTGTFQFSHAVVREIEDKVDAKPTQSEECSGDVSASTNIAVFEVTGTEFTVQVNPRTMKICGHLSSAVKAILNGRTIKEAVDNGQLKYVKTVKNLKPTGMESCKQEIDVGDIYMDNATNSTILVNPSTFLIEGKNTLNVSNVQRGDNAKAKITSGDLIKVGTKVVKMTDSTSKPCGSQTKSIFHTFMFKKDDVEEEVELCQMGLRSVLRLPLISPHICDHLVMTDYPTLVESGTFVLKHASVKNELELRNLLEALAESNDTNIEFQLFNSDEKTKVKENTDGTKTIGAEDRNRLPPDSRNLSVEELEAEGKLQNPQEAEKSQDALLVKLTEVLQLTRATATADSVQMTTNKDMGCIILINFADKVMYVIKEEKNELPAQQPTLKVEENETPPTQTSLCQEVNEGSGDNAEVSKAAANDSDDDVFFGDEFDEYISGDDMGNTSDEGSISKSDHSDDDPDFMSVGMHATPSFCRKRKRKKNMKSINEGRMRRRAKRLRTGANVTAQLAQIINFMEEEKQQVGQGRDKVIFDGEKIMQKGLPVTLSTIEMCLPVLLGLRIISKMVRIPLISPQFFFRL